MMNGTHTDSLGPDTISRWLEFLDLYVADRVPTAVPDPRRAGAHRVLAASPAAPHRHRSPPSASRRALGRRGQGRLRRAGSPGPGALRQRRRHPRTGRPAAHLRGGVLDLAARPAPSCTSASGPTARSGPGTPRGSSTASFRPDPSVRPADDLAASANAWAAQPPYDWTTVPAANGIAFETPAFTTATTIVGPGQPQPHAAVDGARHRPAGDGDRGPTGRDAGGVRHLGLPAQQRPHAVASSTVLDPVPTYLAADRRNLPQRALHPRADPGRPHRAHVPGRDPPAHRHLRARRGPPVVDLRHAGHPRRGGRHRGARRRAGARRWWSTRWAGSSRPPPCRPAAHCEASPAGPMRRWATSGGDRTAVTGSG